MLSLEGKKMIGIPGHFSYASMKVGERIAQRHIINNFGQLRELTRVGALY